MAATPVKYLPTVKGRWLRPPDAADLLVELLGNTRSWESYLGGDRRTRNDGYQQVQCVMFDGRIYYDSADVEAFASHINAGGALHLKPHESHKPTSEEDLRERMYKYANECLSLRDRAEIAKKMAREAAAALKTLRRMSGAGHA